MKAIRLLALLITLVLPLADAGAREKITSDALMRHVHELASERHAGRPAGTEHELAAARYVAARLDESSIAPPPGVARFQVFPLGEGESRNVLAWIPGTSRETIVLGAHYDHLGRTLSGLHPGADDNASGVALALEIAAALGRRDAKPGRSILIVFFGAEEVGLVGSRYFVARPPVSIERIVAMINIDMIGRPLADLPALEPLKRLARIDSNQSVGALGARGRPAFVSAIESSCEREKLQVFGTRSIPFVTQIVEGMARNRSDNAPFERVGIPTIFFGSGESSDYHRPTDTVDKILPELLARRSRAVHDTLVALADAPAGSLPSIENALPPSGDGVKLVTTLRIKAGDLDVHLRDNSTSPGELGGLQSLFNTRDAPGFDAFDPEAPGASAGLNFEHIISGHESRANKFTPRHGTYRLFATGEHSATLVRRREDSPWDVSSTLTYTARPPNAIDFEFRCTPHSPERFGPRGWAIFFFANYMNDVADEAIRFRGIAEEGAEESWISASAPPGHADWNRGGTYRHVKAGPLEYDEDVTFRLNSWSYDWPRFTKPLYHGRAARDMVAILMFDRARTAEDEIRFSLFKFKLPERPRPAWDFQYVIRDTRRAPSAGGSYGFRGRLVWKNWVSEEDCEAEYEHFASE